MHIRAIAIEGAMQKKKTHKKTQKKNKKKHKKTHKKKKKKKKIRTNDVAMLRFSLKQLD